MNGINNNLPKYGRAQARKAEFHEAPISGPLAPAGFSPPPRASSGAVPLFQWLLCPMAVLILCGCSSLTKPAGASFASVVIARHGPEEICHVAIDVFKSAGYESRISTQGDLVFEKGAPLNDRTTHDGWSPGGATMERVRAEIVTLDDGTHRLQCKAYKVVDAGDRVFEKEQRLANFRSGPYQALLDKVAAKLR